jgi:lipid-A-disaccharide synthase-like uncharacterized protein
MRRYSFIYKYMPHLNSNSVLKCVFLRKSKHARAITLIYLPDKGVKFPVSYSATHNNPSAIMRNTRVHKNRSHITFTLAPYIVLSDCVKCWILIGYNSGHFFSLKCCWKNLISDIKRVKGNRNEVPNLLWSMHTSFYSMYQSRTITYMTELKKTWIVFVYGIESLIIKKSVA